MPISARDQRGRGRSLAILLAADAGAGAERARELTGGKLLRQVPRFRQARVESMYRDARLPPSSAEITLPWKKDPVDVRRKRGEIYGTPARAS